MRDGPANIRGVLVLAAAGYLLFLPLWMALVSAFRRKRKMLWAVIPLPIYIVLVTALAFPLFHPSIHRVGTDAELEPLKGSARLSILLVGGEVTDAGLEHSQRTAATQRVVPFQHCGHGRWPDTP